MNTNICLIVKIWKTHFLKAGFSKVKIRGFDEEMHKKERDFGSIYAIAYK